MFDLAKSSFFFERMDAEYPTLVQNIDIVNENRRALDATYHQPKHFILSLNNILRSLLFFIEGSIKNSPKWLKDSVSSFRDSRQKDYQTLKHLRNVSAHQKLIFPAESLVGGLFRIRSNNDYLLKLGLGDHNKPGSYAPDMALKNTVDIFDDFLTFSSIAFMDLEHSAFAECLGITRRWFYKVSFKFDHLNIQEIIDVYALASGFSASLLDHVCNSYALEKGVQHEEGFSQSRAEHNNVNTLLELDLYPSLFSEWWEDDIEPLNYGVRLDRQKGRQHLASDEYYSWVYTHLTKDQQDYRAALVKFRELTPATIFSEDHLMDFLSFVTNNHWHFKTAFPGGFTKSQVAPAEVMMLQRFGRILVDEFKTEKLCTIDAAKKQLNAHLEKMEKMLAEAPRT